MMNPYMMAGPGRGMPGRGPRGMMMPPQVRAGWLGGGVGVCWLNGGGV